MPDQPDPTTQTARERPESAEADEAFILQRLITELSALPGDARRRLIETVCTFFDIARPRIHGDPLPPTPVSSLTTPSVPFRFAQEEEVSPKQFMQGKEPATDVERVACLAYFLTHYRSTPHFKTKDITDLNTEAAQRRFSNTAFTVVNATNAGYLVPSVKGCKQLSAAGERFVEALPDRQAAREMLERAKPRRMAKRSRTKAARASSR